MGRPKKAESEKKTEKKTPSWTFIFYPESKTLQECKDTLNELHLTYVISPLHDKDINPDGTPKKPHYHILLKYPNNKTFEQVKEVTDALISPIPQPCLNVCGMIRYFIHIDNPEKAQYSKADIYTCGMIDIEDYFKLSNTDKANKAMEILRFCEENGIDNLFQLNNYCMQNNADWFNFIFNNTYYIDRVLCSKHKLAREKKEDERLERIDRKNGILPPLQESKTDEKEIENLAELALQTEKENIVSKRNKK